MSSAIFSSPQHAFFLSNIKGGLKFPENDPFSFSNDFDRFAWHPGDQMVKFEVALHSIRFPMGTLTNLSPKLFSLGAEIPHVIAFFPAEAAVPTYRIRLQSLMYSPELLADTLSKAIKLPKFSAMLKFELFENNNGGGYGSEFLDKKSLA